MKRLISVGLIGLAAYGIVQLVRMRAKKTTSPIMFSVTINRTPQIVYTFFRDFSRLPTFMDWLESVEEQADGHSHWVAKLINGKRVEWDAFLTEDTPGQAIAWEARATASFTHTGRVTFVRAPGRDSTEVRVEMAISGSRLLAKVLAKPQIKGDLRRLKQVLEIGEVVKSDASIHRKVHAAQPAMAGEVVS